MTEKQNRVAIIGCGNINAANIYSLLAGGFVEELILVDADDKLAGEVAGLRRALPLAHPASVRRGDYKDAAQAEIVVIAAGAEAGPDESSLDLFIENAVIVREISAQLKRDEFGGIILIITNPVDILAQIAQSESGLPANRVIGSGIGLEMSQPPALPEEKPEVKTRSVQLLPVLGETAETATWCAAMTGGEPLVDFCTPDCPDFGKMLEALRHSAPPADRSKRIPFSAGTCVNRICEAILGDEREILPVSAMTGGQYGVSGVYMNLPCVVGRRGVERVVELPLAEDEKRALLDAAANLHKTYKSFLKKNNKCSTATAK